MKRNGYGELKFYLKKRHITYGEIAVLLGVSSMCIWNKMNGHSDFRIGEAADIIRVFKIPRKFFYRKSCEYDNKMNA